MPAVLFDGRLALPRPTGIGQYIASLVPALLASAPDWHVHLLHGPAPFAGYGLADLDAPNLTRHVSRVSPMRAGQQWAIPRLARRLGVDLVHYPHFDAPVVMSGPPIVATFHDLKYLVRPDFFLRFGQVRRALMWLAFAMSARWAEAIIAVSAATAADARRLLPGLRAPLHVVPEAADAAFRPVPAAAIADLRSRFGLTRPFILSVGERRPHKNHAGLIEAFAASGCARTHDLVIVGQRYRDDDAPERAVDRLGLHERVRLLDGVGFPDLVAFYGAAALFVLNSYHEGFGLPLLEAMACGTPVVATSEPASAEVAGGAALLVAPGDRDQLAAALKRLVGDDAERAALARLGLARARAFSWERAGRQTLAVYREVLGG